MVGDEGSQVYIETVVELSDKADRFGHMHGHVMEKARTTSLN
jgi:hypothetical protein